MLELNNASLMVSLQVLLGNNMELLSKNIELYRSLYKAIKDIEQNIPQLVKTKWSLDEWNKKLDAHLKSREAELLELHKNIMKILSEPLVFNDLYQYAILVLKKINEFSAENFLIPKECREEFERAAKIAGPLLPMSQNLSVYNVDLLSAWSESSKKMGEVYHYFLQRLLFAAVSHISLYFDKIFRQHNIAITEGETAESISKKISDASKQNAALKKILIEFKLANALVINPPYIGNIHIRRNLFDAVKKIALEVDQDLKQHREIQRINYLNQILDPTMNYIPGYCAFDALAWLQSNEEIGDTQAKTKLENYQDFQPLHWNYPANRVDFLESNLQLSKQFLKFGYYVSSSSATESKEDSEFFNTLSKDINIVFHEHQLNNVNIQITKNAEEAHALGLKRQGPYFYFRDVNQGTFRFKKLESFFAWLPTYFKKMGYEGYTKSYLIHFLPKTDFQLNEDPFYHAAYLNLLRLRPVIKLSEPSKETDELLKSIAQAIFNNSDDKYSELLKFIYNAMIYEKEQWTALSNIGELANSMMANDMARVLNIVMKEEILSPFKIEESNFPSLLKKELRLLSFIEAMEDILPDFADSDDSDNEQESNKASDTKIMRIDLSKEALSEVETTWVKLNKIPKVLAEYSEISDCALHISVKETYEKMVSFKNPKDPQIHMQFEVWHQKNYRLVLIATLKAIQSNVSLEICHQKVQAALKLTEGQREVNSILHQYGKLGFAAIKLISEYCAEEEYPKGKALVRI